MTGVSPSPAGTGQERPQVVQPATARELYLGRLTKHEHDRLARLLEKALPGVVSASEWPPPPTNA